MGTVHIRRLDDEVVRRLKRRAAENNRSLESESRHILEQAAYGGMAEKIKTFRTLSRRLRRQTNTLPQTSSVVLIRDDREIGHGPA